MYIILNKLKPLPQFRDEYVRLLREEIAVALQKEPGMVRFDILEDASDPGQFYVYEVWTDREAFDFHHRQPYRNVFIDTTKDWYAVRPKSPGEIIARNIWPPDSSYTPQNRAGL